MLRVQSPVILISTFLWIGFVAAISFMEAWLKFRAPGITIPLGLGIGQLVFGALNKIEWVFAVSILFIICTTHRPILSLNTTLFIIPLLLLLMQTIWLLPLLDIRAELYLAGSEVKPAYYHYYYIFAEVIKSMCLFLFGFRSFIKPQTSDASDGNLAL